MNNGLRYGLVSGGLLVVLYFLFYFLNPRAMLGQILYWSSMVIPVVAMILACNADKSERVDAVFPFGDALKTSFITGVVSTVIFSIFYFVLLKFIDPTLMDLQRDVALEQIEAFADFMPAETYDEAIEGIETAPILTIGNSMLNLMLSIIGTFGISCIVSLIVKRDPKH